MEDLLVKINIAHFLTIMVGLLLVAWYGGHRFGKIETAIEWIKEEIGELKGKVSGAEGSASPLNPTETGATWLKESGLEDIIDKPEKEGGKREWLLDKLKGVLPEETEYDVQTYARRLMVELRDEEIMKGVKKYAFDNGVDVDTILRVGGLWLRDNFLNTPHSVSENKMSSTVLE